MDLLKGWIVVMRDTGDQSGAEPARGRTECRGVMTGDEGEVVLHAARDELLKRWCRTLGRNPADRLRVHVFGIEHPGQRQMPDTTERGS